MLRIWQRHFLLKDTAEKQVKMISMSTQVPSAETKRRNSSFGAGEILSRTFDSRFSICLAHKKMMCIINFFCFQDFAKFIYAVRSDHYCANQHPKWRLAGLSLQADASWPSHHCHCCRNKPATGSSKISLLKNETMRLGCSQKRSHGAVRPFSRVLSRACESCACTRLQHTQPRLWAKLSQQSLAMPVITP